MSLNTAHTDGGVVIYQGEVILLHADNTILSFSGSDDLKKFSELTGNSYLTTHRLIFLSKSSKTELKSFSFPFCVLSEVNVEQPVFGANFLKGKVRAQPNGNWRGEAKFKLNFKSGGAIDFATGMMKAIHIARQVSAQNEYWNAPPPAYETAASMPAPSTAYAPTGAFYGWTPPAYDFPPPAAGSVYVMDAPPPYPGIINPQGTTVAGVDIGQTYPQPGMYPQQQGAYPQQQAAYPQQQGMYQQPGMYPQQGMYQPQPGMYPQQPGMFQQQPGMYPQAPGMYGQQGYPNGNVAPPPPYNYNQQNGPTDYPPSSGNKKFD